MNTTKSDLAGAVRAALAQNVPHPDRARSSVQTRTLSPTNVEQSTNEFKRAGLLSLQLLAVLTTLAATVVMLMHPVCVEHMLAEVARGLAAALLLAGVKLLVHLHKMACKPVSCCWGRFGCAMTWRELKHGLVAGYLLGLVVAMWVCWNG